MIIRKGTDTDGRVTDTANKPISGAKIFFDFSSGVVSDKPIATTNNDGEFRFSGLDPGLLKRRPPAQITVMSPGFAPQIVDLEKLGQPLAIQLQPGYTIRGRIIDRNGQPIEKARISPTDLRRLRLRTKSDANGEFQIEDVPNKAVAFSVSKPGFQVVSRFGMAPDTRSAEPRYTITMHPAFRVSGSIIDADTEKTDHQLHACPRF